MNIQDLMYDHAGQDMPPIILTTKYENPGSCCIKCLGVE